MIELGITHGLTLYMAFIGRYFRVAMSVVKEFAEWFARKLCWFFFVPLISLLGYYTQIRPYILEIHGVYSTGFMDGVFSTVSILIFVLWLISKLRTEEPKVVKNE